MPQARTGASSLRPETDPLSLHLDQTTPQTVINGTPTFPDLKLAGMVLGTPTYKSLQDAFNGIQSSGSLTGMTITAHAPANGTVDVSAGTGIIKTTNANPAATKFFDFAGVSGVSLTDGVLNYLYIDYNGGTPQILVTTDRTTVHDYDQFIIGRVFRQGTDATEIAMTGVDVYNEYRRIHDRLLIKYGFNNAQGSATSETDTRKLAVTAGTWYIGNTQIPTAAHDSNAGYTFSTYYYNGSAWIKTTGVSQLGNTQYNDITTGLVTMTNNKYANYWVYLDPLGDFYVQYGQAQYNSLAEAQATQSPATNPTYIQENTALIARISFQKSATNFAAVSNALITPISQGVATNHNNLAGLQGGAVNEYYHLTSAEYTGTGTGNFVRLDSPVFTTKITAPVIYGSSSASGTLTLESTSNATKGKILLGTSAYDEVNNRLGLGTASPIATLDTLGCIRALNGGSVPATGEGIEFFMASDTGYLTAYDRTGSAYKVMNIDGSTLNLNTASNGNVVVGTGSFITGGYAYLGGTGSTGLRIKGTDYTNTIYQPNSNQALGIVANGGVINLGQLSATPGLAISATTVTANLTLALGSNNLTMTGSIGATGARVTKLWATDVEVTNGITVNGAASAGKLLRGDGSHFVATTLTMPDTIAKGELFYASATNVLTALGTSGDAAVLSMDATTHVPTWLYAANGVLGYDITGFGWKTTSLTGFQVLYADGAGNIAFSDSPVLYTNLTVPLLYGSSAANGDITIRGTSHATKTSSYVILQDTGGYVGIGTTTPVFNLDVVSASDNATIQVNSPTAKNANIYFANNGTLSSAIYRPASTDELRIYQGADVASFKAGSFGLGIVPVKKLQINLGTNENWAMQDVSGVAQFLAMNDNASAYVAGLIDAKDLLINVYSGGKVGIGTATPNLDLVLKKATSGNAVATAIYNTDTSGYNVLRLGIDTNTASGAALHYFNSAWTDSGAGTARRPNQTSLDSFGSNGLCLVSNNENIHFYAGGTASTNRIAAISSAGLVIFSLANAPGLKCDAGGLIVSTSDERVKDIREKFTRGLEAINQIEPILYTYKEESPYTSIDAKGIEHISLGFSAQNVGKAIPEAISEGVQGYLQLSDTAIIATLVNAIKELSARVSKLESK